jgi:hypothetical protein
MEKFDPSKPYRTRDGRKAWAAASPEPMTIGSHLFWLIGWIEHEGRRNPAYWDDDGRIVLLFGESGSGGDLVNIPETRTVKVWINVYPDGDMPTPGYRMGGYTTETEANIMAHPSRVACIEREITFIVGEGLDQ